MILFVSYLFVVKELVTKYLNLVFEVVGGCSLKESLQAYIVDVATPSRDLWV